MTTVSDTSDKTCAAGAHGSRRAYADHGCRCPDTVEAMRRNWRRKRPTGRRMGPGSRPVSPDVDPVAVQRATAGDRTVRLTSAELTVAVAELTGRDMSARHIAVLLGVSDRTVTRHRARHRAQPVDDAVDDGLRGVA